MPVKQMGAKHSSPVASQLLDRLVIEWSSPQPGATQPVIVEKHDAAGRLVHVYVVWQEWESLEHDERAELILDACSKVKGHTDDVTVAMGLTPAEADRMRIPYR